MTAQELLTELQQNSIHLGLKDDTQIYVKDSVAIPQDLLSELKEHKWEVIQLLQSKPPTPTKSSSRAEIKTAMTRLECGECSYIKIYSTTLKAYMYFVRDGEGITLPPERLVTFSLSELRQLTGSSIEHIKAVYLVKQAFNARIVGDVNH